MWDFSIQTLQNNSLRQWAIDSGSTCQKCPTLQIQGLKIEPVNNWALMQKGYPGLLRSSLLYVDSAPWMFAQAFTSATNTYLIAKLNNPEPIGKWLFNLGCIRSEFKFSDSKSFINLVSPQHPILARQSSFNSTQFGSLLLLEVFLEHPMWN